jgi:hypothetical protein
VWDESLEAEGALRTARTMALELDVIGCAAPDDHRAIEHAVIAMCDLNRIEEAGTLVDEWGKIVHAEAMASPYGPQDLYHHHMPVLRARYLFRASDHMGAATFASLARREATMLRHRSLPVRSRQLAGIPPHRLPTAARARLIRADSIALPAFRVAAARGHAWRAQLDVVLDEALAICLADDFDPVCGGGHGLVRQSLFAVAELEHTTEREAQLQQLLTLDRASMPDTARARATSLLPPMAVAAFRGDRKQERELAVTAHAALVEAGLQRHIDVLIARRWWPLVAK